MSRKKRSSHDQQEEHVVDFASVEPCRKPDAPCGFHNLKGPGCGGTRFWALQEGGPWICARCHPPHLKNREPIYYEVGEML